MTWVLWVALYCDLLCFTVDLNYVYLLLDARCSLLETGCAVDMFDNLLIALVGACCCFFAFGMIAVLYLSLFD